MTNILNMHLIGNLVIVFIFIKTVHVSLQMLAIGTTTNPMNILEDLLKFIIIFTIFHDKFDLFFIFCIFVKRKIFLIFMGFASFHYWWDKMGLGLVQSSLLVWLIHFWRDFHQLFETFFSFMVHHSFQFCEGLAIRVWAKLIF